MCSYKSAVMNVDKCLLVEMLSITCSTSTTYSEIIGSVPVALVAAGKRLLFDGMYGQEG